jgi:HYDIN/CFA65/VesB family protein/centrosomal CEP192-like protein
MRFRLSRPNLSRAMGEWSYRCAGFSVALAHRPAHFKNRKKLLPLRFRITRKRRVHLESLLGKWSVVNRTRPQILITFNIAALAFCVLAWSQSTVGQMYILQEVRHDTSPPLREMRALAEVTGPIERDIKMHITPVPEQQDPVVQTSTLSALSPAPSLSFEGLGEAEYGFLVNFAPPDTNGAVGATQYVQWVNASFAVFDKNTGAVLHGPVAGNTLWVGFGGACENDNDGDVLAQYDKLAGRWVMSQLAVRGGPPFFECVAVSTTDDATGSYHRYAFAFANFEDYPKIGIWSDAYYFSFNMFDPTVSFFKGADACAMNRSAMLNGTAATMICFQQGISVFGLLPSDLDGTTPPPAGEPNFFMNYGVNSLNLWKFHVDFASPANSTFTGPTNIPVAAFTVACNKFADLICIEQPSTTIMLDSLADRLMYRLAYRRFTGTSAHESLLVNHTVGSPSGIRWYEIRNPNGAPAVFQQGTFQPDSNFRWMGSIAMDHVGDIALGYSVSSTAVHPSIALTGRVPGDPLGTMERETTIINGTGSQTNLLTRWGDYSAMAVDPVDDCTFWYTQEYMRTTGSFNWNTRIARFKFPTCSSRPVTLSPGALTFATTVLGVTSAAETVTLTNTGTATLNLTSITPSGDFAVKTTTCAATLAVGASCNVSVTFKPTAIGARTGSLTFVDGASTSPQTVSLNGTGTAIAFSPKSLSLGTVVVGSLGPRKLVTITNVSTATVTFSGFALAGTNPGDFLISSNSCGTLAAGASCAVGLKFRPQAIGTRKATLDVSDDGGGSPQVLNVSGNGTIVSLSATALNFGTVVVGNTSAAKAVTLTNTGSGILSIAGFSILGTNPGDFLISANSCGSLLAAGTNCVVQVTFKPAATGVRKATLSISDDGGGSPQKVSLAGTGG